MRNLADTIARLAAHRQRSFGEPRPGADRLAEMTGLGSNPGQLDARIHVPAALGRNAPLVVVLHGCTQTAAGYDHAAGWSRLADREGFAVLYPQQRRSNNPNLCFNWFNPGDSRRGEGEAHSVSQMIETMVETHGLDRRRIFVTGLSAGGAMAAALLASYPEIFQGGAIIAGLPYAVAASVPEAFDRMRGHGAPDRRELQARLERASDHAGPWPRISVWHGDADQTVAVSNAELTVAQWQAAHETHGTPVREETVNGHRRLVWRNGRGEEAIELHVLPGMAHGTPLDTADGLSHGAPYMIDVGISSTLHISRFWGLVDDAGPAAGTQRPAQPASSPPAAGANARPRPAKTPDASAGSVHRIIEDALRKAGLMK